MFVSIEGNIGVGKTTIVNKLKIQYGNDFAYFLEPVDSFCKFEKYNPLQLSYENPEKYAFVTQLHIINQTLNYYPTKNTPKSNIISERCTTSSYAFIEKDYQNGLFNEFQYDFLRDYLFKNQIRENMLVPDLIIYLKGDVNVCFNRIQERNRKEEQKLSKKLLYDLDKATDSFLNLMSDHFKSNIFTVDANSTLENTLEQVFTVIQKTFYK